MKLYNVKCRCLKVLVSIQIFAVMLIAGSAIAAEISAVKVYPEHVGMYTTVKTQQYVAYGLVDAGGGTAGMINITKNVDWISSNEDIVTIDENGLATLVTGVTSGQVKITCSYPKTGNIGPATNLLLLNSVQLQ